MKDMKSMKFNTSSRGIIFNFIRPLVAAKFDCDAAAFGTSSLHVLHALHGELRSF